MEVTVLILIQFPLFLMTYCLSSPTRVFYRSKSVLYLSPLDFLMDAVCSLSYLFYLYFNLSVTYFLF